MTSNVSEKLMMGVLAMDSYHRNVTGDSTLNHGLGLTETGIGKYETAIIGSSEFSYNSSFFANAYTYTDDYNKVHTVISYRGTDNLAIDPLTGWPIGVSITGVPQAGLAMDFYEYVTTYSATQALAPSDRQLITTTGHSLGGGLAGYIAAMTGAKGYGYDYMPFGPAAVESVTQAYKNLNLGVAISPQSLEANGMRVPDPDGFEGFYVAGEILQTVRGIAQMMDTPEYDEHDNFIPSSLGEITGSSYDAYETYVTKTSYSAYGASGFGPLDLHDAALLNILMFADEEEFHGRLSSSWHTSGFAPFLLEAMYRNTNAVKLDSSLSDDLLRTMLAYSIVDEGERPYGDIAIRAMFGDAALIGSMGPMIPVFTSDDIIAATADLIVLNAGSLARQKAMLSSWTNNSNMLSVNGNGLVFDFDNLNPDSFTGVQTLVSSAISYLKTTWSSDAASTNFINSSLTSANLYPFITNVAFGINGFNFSNPTIDTQALPAGYNGALLVGANGNDTLVGGAENDIIVGGSGIDVLRGDDGVDILIGADGNDTLIGGLGSDYISGGVGTDRAVFETAAGSSAPISIDRISDDRVDVTNGYDIDKLHSIERIVAGDGNDQIYYSVSATNPGTVTSRLIVDGGSGNDVFHGWSGVEVFVGGAGLDTIYGSLGADEYYDEDNVLFDYSTSPTGVRIESTGSTEYVGHGGFAEGDTISLTGMLNTSTEWSLTPFADKLILTNPGETTIRSGSGDDIISVISHDVSAFVGGNIYGGNGKDTISTSNFIGNIYGEGDDDTITAIGLNGEIHGGGGKDTIIATEGVGPIQVIYGGDEVDTITAYGNHIIVFGGDGADILNANTVSYQDAPTAIAMNGFNGTVGFAAGDVIDPGLLDFTIYGSNHGDTFTSVAANRLFLGSGDDTVMGTTDGEIIFTGGGDDEIHITASTTLIAFDEPGFGTIHLSYQSDLIFINGYDETNALFVIETNPLYLPPVVNVAYSSEDTNVTFDWYKPNPDAGEPPILVGTTNLDFEYVLLSGFVQGQDYLLV